LERTSRREDEGRGATYVTYLRFINFFFYNISALFRPPVRMVFSRQMFFTSVEALVSISIMAALAGMVIITQISQAFGYDAALIGRVMLWAVVRELGPLITAIFVIAGSGAAVTAELATMKVNGEFGSLRIMGINPIDYLVVPRMAAVILSMFFLNLYFQVAAMLGGFTLSAALIDISFTQHVSSTFANVGADDAAVSIVKSLVFGGAVAATACSHGAMVGPSITGIPKAILNAQMRGLFLVFIAEGFITYFTLP